MVLKALHRAEHYTQTTNDRKHRRRILSLKSKGRTEWTPEKRAALLETAIVAGSKAIDVEKVAADLGVSKSSVIDQLKPNRSNLRQAAIKAVKGANK